MGDNADLQSWPEVPSIAHFCSLFRHAFDLLEFDIQEFEESLLLMGTEDDALQLVPRLVIKLVQGCSPTFTRNINTDNFNTYLRRLVLSKRDDCEEDGVQFGLDCSALVDQDVDFVDLGLRDRVRILQKLCEFRLDANDVFDKLKNLDADSLRVDPLGVDHDGVTYWYFYGTRLYREDPLPKESKEERKKRKEREKKKKKKDKKDKKKKKKKHRDSVSSDEEVSSPLVPKWSVACLTLQDWEELAQKYSQSKRKTDVELHDTLSESFLPEIKKMFAEKEREERRRLLMLEPKRTSTRIEKKKKEQEEKDRVLAEQMEEIRTMEEEHDEKVRFERREESSRGGTEDDDEEEPEEGSREERQKNREMMKELRARRAAERAVEKEFNTEVVKQKADMKKKEPASPSANGSRKSKHGKHGSGAASTKFENPLEVSDNDSNDSTYEPPSGDHDRPPPPTNNAHSNAAPPAHAAAAAAANNAKSNFANALLRAGVKSTKDATLDKPMQKKPGSLLDTAGRSLMQRGKAAGNLAAATGAAAGRTSSTFDSLLGVGGGVGAIEGGKLSFGLWTGSLSMDHGSYSKPPRGACDDDYVRRSGAARAAERAAAAEQSDSAAAAHSGGAVDDADADGSAAAAAVKPVRKVFSNWGGEFFKKNLDYRANTNKILEKMNMIKDGGGLGASRVGGGSAATNGFSAAEPVVVGVSSPQKPFAHILNSLSSAAAAKRPLEPNSAAAGAPLDAAALPPKKVKPNPFLSSTLA